MPRLHLPRLVLAAPGTGQGKTTVAAALMRLLRDRGLRVAPFKAGPDYVDPTHHRAAAGMASRNLDGWLLPPDTLRALFRRAVTGDREADVAVVEGMMGLFDGRSATSDEGSTAQTAKLLGAPVVLVLDVWTMARTAAAVVKGLHTFDPALPLAGVVLNRAAGPGHHALCRDAILGETDVPVLGWLPADAALAVPERDLGLVLAGEAPLDLDRLAARAGETLDVDGLLAVARAAPPLPDGPDPLPAPAGERRAVIAVARDAAFDFYYEDNLDLLRDLGAELRFFSPLADARLPEDAGALYLGGGYPELHAARLAANGPMRAAVRAFAARGRPVYAECGGLMYLSEALVDAAGTRHPMAGVVPGASAMQPRPTLGYRQVVALRDSPIARAGDTVRGHEFHYSAREADAGEPAYRRADGAETEGVIAGPRGNVLASYLHLHFATDPRMAERLVALAADGGAAGAGLASPAADPEDEGRTPGEEMDR
ncbi:MAG TPA: cobyrinate a,c-diamide synthase [Longimicrobiaceae bacterium]|nr:cobyrinate a,c-diamide synthase [Longimicrobiaceae bacterium]